MDDEISVLVLFGGMSPEHDVSCASAASVLSNIDRKKYDVNAVGITRDGNWLLTNAAPKDVHDGSWEDNAENKRVIISTNRDMKGALVENADGSFKLLDVDVVFPVLHGENGEDGSMQGLLKLAGLPFVGTGLASSVLSMDKAITKAIIDEAGVVDQAKCYVMHRREYQNDQSSEIGSLMDYFDGGFPLFVKPTKTGSSVGVTKAKNKDELPVAIDKAFKEDDKIVVEETIVGREIEIAVLGNEDPKASCIGEIFSANEFYDYDAKYQNEESRTGIVTDLDKKKEDEIRQKAVEVYKALDCRGLSRVDFFLMKDGKIVFNEINNMPGFTDKSMYAKLWEASGLSYDKLVDKLIQLALEVND